MFQDSFFQPEKKPGSGRRSPLSLAAHASPASPHRPAADEDRRTAKVEVYSAFLAPRHRAPPPPPPAKRKSSPASARVKRSPASAPSTGQSSSRRSRSPRDLRGDALGRRRRRAASEGGSRAASSGVLGGVPSARPGAASSGSGGPVRAIGDVKPPPAGQIGRPGYPRSPAQARRRWRGHRRGDDRRLRTRRQGPASLRSITPSGPRRPRRRPAMGRAHDHAMDPPRPVVFVVTVRFHSEVGRRGRPQGVGPRPLPVRVREIPHEITGPAGELPAVRPGPSGSREDGEYE